MSNLFSAGFILHDALFVSLLVGGLLPLVGIYVVWRRLLFLAVALPQIAAGGIAVALLLANIFLVGHLHGNVSERTIAICGAVFMCILALALLTARPTGLHQDSQVGVLYALSGAIMVLALSLDPHGDLLMTTLLRGDMLGVTRWHTVATLLVLGTSSGMTILFRRQLNLVSFDSTFARAAGLSIAKLELLFYFLLATTVGFAVFVAGPLVVFGDLVLPVLIARNIARSVSPLPLLASFIGVVTSLLGFLAAYHLDLPLGPTITLLQILFLMFSLVLGTKFFENFHKTRKLSAEIHE